MKNTIEVVPITVFLGLLLLFAMETGADTLILDEVSTQLIASDAQLLDGFGASISVDGDTAVFGAPGDDDKGDGAGSAYIFIRDESGLWYEQQKLTAADGGEGDAFGSTVAVPATSVSRMQSGPIRILKRDGDFSIFQAFLHTPTTASRLSMV
jgi:hypothetical protein